MFLPRLILGGVNEKARLFAKTAMLWRCTSQFCESFLVKNKHLAGGRNRRNELISRGRETFCDIFPGPEKIWSAHFFKSKNCTSGVLFKECFPFAPERLKKPGTICSLRCRAIVGVLCGIRLALMQRLTLNLLTRPGGLVYRHRHTADQAAPLLQPTLSELRSDLAAAHESFSSATVLPAQFFNPSHGADPARGEVALLRAILEDAIHCFQKQFISRRPRTLRLAKEAEEWLFTDDDKWPLSFVNVCAVLGVDPAYLRRELKQLSLQPSALSQRKKPRGRSARARLKLAA